MITRLQSFIILLLIAALLSACNRRENNNTLATNVPTQPAPAVILSTMPPAAPTAQPLPAIPAPSTETQPAAPAPTVAPTLDPGVEATAQALLDKLDSLLNAQDSAESELNQSIP